ncbi:MFS transporter [Streptacidiphilus pinicola]|uniref:MFS transporter n=1 Tax=Streptacidiphilus pinicola TaxID=2219663 RepID=A0A2X0INU2_9ACTN|nr:MFS transporter [Streptacidiphilus pinicola]RAG86882.1 MFS transporter [Streptacidiphilus pinicola]
MRGRSALPRYLATAFCARLADEGVGVAVVMLAAQRTGDASRGAFVLTAWMAPHVLAAPLTGALAARTRRPRLFFAGALSGFALAIALVGPAFGRVPLPVVLALAAAGGCCGPAVSGGLSGLLPRLTGAETGGDRAAAWDAASYNAAGVAGPAVAGLVSAALSPALALGLLSTAAACAAALTTLLPVPAGTDSAHASRPQLHRDLVDGALTVWQRPELRAVTAATTLAYVGLGGLTTTSVLLAQHLATADRAAGGLLMTAFAVGGLAGTLVTTRMPSRVTAPRLALVGLLGTGSGLAAAAMAPGLPAAAACFVTAGACEGLVLTATLRVRAEQAPQQQRPQVFTLGAGLKISAAALGSALAGWDSPGAARRYLAAIAVLQLAAAALHAGIRRASRPEIRPRGAGRRRAAESVQRP